MKRSYNNPWIPEEALAILAAHEGSLLDVGGGAAPYCHATHILDALPFSAERLAANAWGGNEVSAFRLARRSFSGGGFHPSSLQYTQLDLCACREWPFRDDQFDLGLCSHCLEDLRDPLPAVHELSRVCRQVLIVVPSRLFEQTRGVDHPRYCGFPHHPWIVEYRDGKVMFRRKTPALMLPACHLVCPIGKTLRLELGCAHILGADLTAEEDPIVWTDDSGDYRRFIEPYKRRHDLFVHDSYRHDLRYWVWQIRQRWFGAA